MAGNLSTSTSIIGDYRINTAGYKSVRARVSSFTSGSITVKGYASVIAGHPTTINSNIITAPAIIKNNQGTTGFSTQDLKDSGRSHVTFYALVPVLSTATDTLQTLTATRAGATVTATTTPAVVTTGKTFRVTKISASYVATATSGFAMVRFRFNNAGLVSITSPISTTFTVGSDNPATANASDIVVIPFSEGMEFASGTGVGFSVQGFAAATPTATGYVLVSVIGYEY